VKSIFTTPLWWAAVAVLSATVVEVSAQTPTSPPVPFLARVDAAVPGLLQKYAEPGIAVAVIDGCKASIRSYGVANRERGTPVRADTVFNLGSISKTFTAWAVMTLIEAGRIKLDDPVDVHLKRWHLPDSPFDRSAVTVRRLLNHTGGISMPSVSGVDRDAALPSLIDELNGSGPGKAPVQVIKAPGETFEYSGGGYAILQLLVEDVTGQPLTTYAKKVLFDPLGMASTSFGWTSQTVQRAATPYLGDGSVYRLREFSAVGAAGLVSTIQDMSLFARAHCAGANAAATHAVLKPATLELMRAQGVPAATLGRGALYALGYNVFPAPSPAFTVAGHSGSNLGWKAEFMTVPAQDLGIVILTNAGDGKTRSDVMSMFREEVRSRLRR
jgi:CubicO group peptidase (beta-lactamase class C family)